MNNNEGSTGGAGEDDVLVGAVERQNAVILQERNRLARYLNGKLPVCKINRVSD